MIRIVTVAIDMEMYRRNFTSNGHVNRWDLICIDNRGSSVGLPKHYNRIIQNHIAEDCWLFFVHEDFEVKSEMAFMEDLDTRNIYGTFGVTLDGHFPVAYGLHICSNKDGSNAVKVGLPVSEPFAVDTLDCQSILIHTSLLRDHETLRFDENLTFDLYAEDFCVSAKYRHDVASMVVPLEFQHYSHGSLSARYAAGLKYLAMKYPEVGVPGSCSFIGGRAEEMGKYFQYNIGANRPASWCGRLGQWFRKQFYIASPS